MSTLTDIRVESATVEVVGHRLDHPLVLSNGVVTELPEITARVTVSDGCSSAEGYGAANLSDAWAWPDPALTSGAKHEAMVDYARGLAGSIGDRVGGPAHPLELGLRLHDSFLAETAHRAPVLARAICASAFDAAIHDAAGQLTARSAFSFYDDDAQVPSADELFPTGAVEAVRTVLRAPHAQLPGWWLIAPGDDLPAAVDRASSCGMTQFKIKLAGSDPAGDADRVAAIHDAVSSRGATVRLSVDTNEGSASPAAVLEFLDRLATIRPAAQDALGYLEQPTPRDSLSRHSWHEVGQRTPVLVDEALSSMDDLVAAGETGWSGFAVKTCKGHSFALVVAAWAAQHDMVVSVQDLTNIGRSAIHSYLLAAHLPSINGIELNSPQYLPGANEPWLPRLAGLFRPTEGAHRLDPSGVVGLGSRL
ncbi:MAG TPA: mandelate racemase/muconate lactonizing enzyme family protein [Bacillota bacterium]|nr:mandelate racemase/muconate lactonizing enzyme family protein [Bacillota bacterium]